MMNDAINKPYTFLDVLQKFNRVEIPVIQRDYAQGRKAEEKIRNNLLDYLLTPLSQSESVELDFIYGYEKAGDAADPRAVFVPVDGQQRLTTLWLLHWLLALKARRLPEFLPLLKRFTYETRPSSKDFLELLCTEGEKLDPDKPLKPQIQNESPWFIDAWKLDSSIAGFLTMLADIEAHPVMQEQDPAVLLDRLRNGAVRFYFLRLENFSLGEEIYTRLNARGKILNEFEVFKSGLFKITSKYPDLHQELAGKIEKDWVDILWHYRKDGVLVDPFILNYIRFLAKMLSLVSNQEISDEALSDPVVCAQIFADRANLAFLIHAFDNLPVLKKLAPTVHFEWVNEQAGLDEELKQVLFHPQSGKNRAPVSEMYVFAALLFLKRYPEGNSIPSGLNDFLRIVRNLLGNTPDRSIREWPTMITSIQSLIDAGAEMYDAYAVLNGLDASKLGGFREEQRYVEKLKARLIAHNAAYRPILEEIDENTYLRGKIANLARLLSEKQKLEDIQGGDFEAANLEAVLRSYEALESHNEASHFEGVWGELLATSMYTCNNSRCWWGEGCNEYDTVYIHPALLKLALYCKNKNVEEALIAREKQYINDECKGITDFSGILNPKKQLYLLYIYTLRVLRGGWKDFFRIGFNFAWLPKEAGYDTPFDNNPFQSGGIFQTYRAYFRNPQEILKERTPIANLAGATTDFNQKLRVFARSEA